MDDALKGFFDNGGDRAFVARIIGTGGADKAVTAQDLRGENSNPAGRQGLAALEADEFRDVCLIAAPGLTGLLIVDALCDHCERHRPLCRARSAAGSADAAALDPRTHRASSYAALYHPGSRLQRRDQAGRSWCRRAATCSASTHASTAIAASGRPRQRAGPRRRRSRISDQRPPAGRAQPARRECHPALPRARHPGLGRAHARQRPGGKYVSVRRYFIFLERSRAGASNGSSSSPTASRSGRR